MTEAEIDNAILKVAQTSWRKVAMIIAKTAEELEIPITENCDESLNIIAQRIEFLIASGKLVAQGDIELWRYSEVRIPTATF